MRWLTLDAIKRHSRIEYDCEDSVLEMYGESAEDTILNIIGRGYTEVVEKFGTPERPIPAPLVHASLLLVEASYNYRGPVTPQNLYVVPFGNLDFMLKPYMKLADDGERRKEKRV